MKLDRRARVATVVAAVVALAVSLSVLFFGVIEVPSFPSVASKPVPEFTGYVAYFPETQRNADDPVPLDQCVYSLVLERGTAERLTCAESLNSRNVGFTSDGKLARLSGGTAEVFDLVSRRSIERFPSRAYELDVESPTAGRPSVYLEHDGDRARVRLAPRREPARVVLSVRGPDDYTFRAAQLSPDGKSLLLVDSESRLLVARADGSNIRLVARNVAASPRPLWFQKGSRAGTFDLAELKALSRLP